MRLTIIDSRNHHLNSLLIHTDDGNPLLSVILPKDNDTLPHDIRQALDVYISPHSRDTVAIHIIIEINDWIDKSMAFILLQNTATLIDKYIKTQLTKTPEYEFAIFEEQQIKPVELYN